MPNFIMKKGADRKSIEDYLRVIHELESQGPVKSIEIAKTLHISKPSVSEMLRKLEKLKMIKLKPYFPVQLTEKGKKEASKLQNKHEIIKSFLEKVKHTNPEKEAHILEHHFSDESICKLQDCFKIKQEIPCYIG